jgi:hypothetical protein
MLKALYIYIYITSNAKHTALSSPLYHGFKKGLEMWVFVKQCRRLIKVVCILKKIKLISFLKKHLDDDILD